MTSAAVHHFTASNNTTTPVAKPLVGFEASSAPHQKQLLVEVATDGEAELLRTQFPGVYAPQSGTGSVEDVIEAARELGKQPSGTSGEGTDRSLLRQLLNAHGGALHFRDLPLRDANDFSRFLFALAEGSGWQPHVDKGLMVLRHPFAPNVATANDGPPDAPIGTHNEFALSSHFPAYISFFCLSPPDAGGETPIVSSLELFDRLRERVPDYVSAIEHQGIAFGIHHPVEKLANTLAGNSLYASTAFGPGEGVDISKLSDEEKRKIADDNVQALGIEGGWEPGLTEGPYWQRRGFEGQWQPDGSLLVLQRVPGVRKHPNFNRPTYFTNLLNNYQYAEDHDSLEPPHHSKKTRLADGSPFLRVPPKIVGLAEDGSEDVVIPKPWVDAVKKTTDEVKVNVPWQLGDVLVLDNLAVQHGRNTWQGDRRLLASLWDRGSR